MAGSDGEGVSRLKDLTKLIIVMMLMAVLYGLCGYWIAFVIDKGFGYGHYYNQLAALAIGIYLVILFAVFMGIVKESRENDDADDNTRV